jgi:membrane-bound serine protease (ClpP class)
MDLTVAYLLIAVGVVLLLSELFLPSSGILFAVGIVAIIGGVAMTFLPSCGGSTSTGLITLIVVGIGLPLGGGVVLRYWRNTAMGKRFFLTTPEEDATIASMPVNLELEQLRGRTGRAVSPLRPSGMVDFNGRRVDCLTEGMMVEPDQWVRCVDVKAGKVIVRPVSKPNLGDLETADFG